MKITIEIPDEAVPKDAKFITFDADGVCAWKGEPALLDRRRPTYIGPRLWATTIPIAFIAEVTRDA